MTVKLKDDRKQNTMQVISDLRKQLSAIPGAMRPRSPNSTSSPTLMTGGNKNVEVDIFGNDLNKLSRIANDVMAECAPSPAWKTSM